MFTLAFSISSSARIITLVTDPMGTGTYGASSGIAQIINKYNTVGLNVKTKPTIGSTELAGLLASGEGQLGCIIVLMLSSLGLPREIFKFMIK